MKTMGIWTALAAVFILAAGWAMRRASGADAQIANSSHTSDLEQLRNEVKRLQGIVPDQAAVMTKVAYHFTNLHEAIQHQNWDLADFYLGEARNNVKWAVRTKPIRKDPQGRDIDLVAISQAVDSSQFEDLHKAIVAKDKNRCDQAYSAALVACYSCHKASGKPYLHPQVPASPEVRIINFDPAATWPQ